MDGRGGPDTRPASLRRREPVLPAVVLRGAAGITESARERSQPRQSGAGQRHLQPRHRGQSRTHRVLRLAEGVHHARDPAGDAGTRPQDRRRRTTPHGVGGDVHLSPARRRRRQQLGRRPGADGGADAVGPGHDRLGQQAIRGPAVRARRPGVHRVRRRPGAAPAGGRSSLRADARSRRSIWITHPRPSRRSSARRMPRRCPRPQAEARVAVADGRIGSWRSPHSTADSSAGLQHS